MDLETLQPSEASSLRSPETVIDLSQAASAWKRRLPLIYAVVALFLAVGFGMMLLATPEMDVSSTLYFPIRTQNLLSSGVGASALTAASALGGPNLLKVNEELLKSQSVLDEVQKAVPDQKRGFLKDKVKITPDLTSNILTVSVQDKDVPLAQRVVRGYVSGLRSVSQRLSVNSLTLDLESIRSELHRHQQLLKRAQDRMVEFQKRQVAPTSVVTSGSGDSPAVLVLPGAWLDQTRSLEVELQRLDPLIVAAKKRIEVSAHSPLILPTEIPVSSKWRTMLVDQQYQLSSARQHFPDTAPNVKLIKSQIELTKRQLSQEIDRYFTSVHMELVDPGYRDLLLKRLSTNTELEAIKRLKARAPLEAERYQGYIRDVATESGIVQKMQGQLAAAQLQSMMDPYQWQVVDDARVGDKPTNKSLLKTGAIFGASGLLTACILAWIVNAVERTVARRRTAAA